MPKENLRIMLDIDRPDFKGAQVFMPLLELWQRSFLPSPHLLEVTDLKAKKIESFTDAAILKGLDRKKYAVT